VTFPHKHKIVINETNSRNGPSASNQPDVPPRAVALPNDVSNPQSRTVSTRPSRRSSQARYWICTIPRDDWIPCLPEGAIWCFGQPELGDSGYRHWQFVVAFPGKVTLTRVRRCLPSGGHYEPTRSEAAIAYVNKEDTRDGEPFEFGARAFNRNSARDWEDIKAKAKAGQIDSIPADVFVRYYSTLRRIAGDFAEPAAICRTVQVFFGPTGTGKSRRAWDEALLGGRSVYPKDPRTKFWYGYRGEDCVIFDEFRGGIDIAHLLRWFDRYPVCVETKGGSVPLAATFVWITSNLHPREWFPGIDSASFAALERRLTITEMNEPFIE